MKRYKILLIVFSSLVFNVNAQNWQWAKRIGGSLQDVGGAKLDANNNIYLGGYFYGSMYLDNDTLIANGIDDLFLAKYNASGNEIWAKRFGGNNAMPDIEQGGGLIDHVHNCIYFTGTFYGSLNISPWGVNSAGSSDAFLAKFDYNGNCIWLKKAGGNGQDSYSAINTASNGNIYWMGVLENPGSLDALNVSSGTFLAKLDSSGNVSWVRHEISGGRASWLKITNNDIFMSGITNNDTTIIDSITLTSTDNMDAFICKLDLNGNAIWAKRFIGPGGDYSGKFELDINKNIYLVGGFNDSINIDGTILHNNGKNDMFFGKFDSTGNVVWLEQSHANGTAGAFCGSIETDLEGNFYIAGTFTGNAIFDAFNINASTIKDMFLARFNGNGNCIGVRHFGEAESGAIQVDNIGDILVSGIFSNTAIVGSTVLTSHGSSDIYFAKSSAITGLGSAGRTANNNLLIYANPTAGKCNITVPDEFLHEQNLTLSIFDNAGKLIQQKTMQMNDGKIKLNLEAEAKGIYNVTLSNGTKSFSGKIVFE